MSNDIVWFACLHVYALHVPRKLLLCCMSRHDILIFVTPRAAHLPRPWTRTKIKPRQLSSIFVCFDLLH